MQTIHNQIKSAVLSFQTFSVPPAPLSVNVFCKKIIWKAPPGYPERKITGYDVNYNIPGGSSRSVIVKKGSKELFHVVRMEDKPTDTSSVFEQVFMDGL